MTAAQDVSATGPATESWRAGRSSGYGFDDQYGHLAPLVAEFAAIAPEDPRRRVLRDELAAAFLPVVTHIARRFRDRGEPLADLEQTGAVGLLGALERFDPARGVEFLGFAVPTITGEIRKHFRDRTWAMRVPRRLKDLQVPIREAVASLSIELGRAPRPSEIAAHLDASVDEIVDALGAHVAYKADSLDSLVDKTGTNRALGDLLGATDDMLGIAQHRGELRRGLAALADRDRTIVVLRFFGDLTQTQIAARVGVSQMHVSRLLSQALARLRLHLDVPN